MPWDVCKWLSVESELHEMYIKALNYADLREIVIVLASPLIPHLTSFLMEICILNMLSNTLNHVIKLFR